MRARRHPRQNRAVEQLASRRRRARLPVLALLVVCAVPPPASGQPDPGLCDIRTSERVVAVGDVHGAYDGLVAILREAGLVDARERWVGGRALLIQTGDVLDRGAESRRVVDLLRRLERDAARAGGRVLALLGNHELMRVVGDWRYVSEGEYKAFTRGDSAALRGAVLERAVRGAAERAAAEKRGFDEASYRAQFVRDVPLGFLEMRAAFDAGGDYGTWVRGRPTLVKVNDIVFMHGGVSETVAPLGCAGINAAIAKELAALPTEPEAIGKLLAAGETGPLWYRGLATEPEDTFERTLIETLGRLAARGFVIGHTPVPGRVVTRFGGRVVLIDSGMLGGEFFPDGVPSALELRGGALTAIFPGGRREPVPAPALAAAAAAASR